MGLITKSYVLEKAKAASGFQYEPNIRAFASNSLLEAIQAASTTQEYDIFLSHAAEDAILIKGLRDELVSHGFTVYVDWIEDPLLDRSLVTRHTAAVLRARMNQCRCLLFATSDASKKSVWMPWELGYVDARTESRVAIAPIVPDSEQNTEFKGQEYLGLYPYLDKTNATLYIHSSISEWVTFKDWLAGKEPAKHY